MYTHRPSAYLAEANHHTVTRITLLIHVKVSVAVGHISIYFLKATLVQQAVNTLAGGKFALSVLGLDPLQAAALLEFLPLLSQFTD